VLITFFGWRGLRRGQKVFPHSHQLELPSNGVPRNFFRGGYARNFFLGRGDSTNSVEDRGQREQGSGGVSPLVRDSPQFANE
jgi:hypothetical protein